MDIGVSAIRNHLETLEQKGYIQHFFKRVTKGRPKKMYKLTGKGSQLFPRMHKEILQKMIENIDEKFGRETLQEILSEIARDMGLELERRLDKEKRNEVLQVKEVLDEWGFYPNLSEKDEAYIIKYNNCLFPEIGREFSGCFCAEIVSTATTTEIKIKKIKCRGNGEDECLHKLISNENKNQE